MTVADLQRQLAELNAERAAASLEGLEADDAYMGALRAEIEATRASLIGAAVTEVATFRATLGGPQMG